jgi:TRAP-type C4-dicarboxylate transport system substrate-binding protein
MLNEDLSPIADTITLVANGQAGEATPIVHDLLGARVLDALQSHKQEIAQTLFAPSADTLTEEIVQEEHESVEDFVKRGGKIKHVAAANAKGSQPAQTIKKAKSYFHSRMNKG